MLSHMLTYLCFKCYAYILIGQVQQQLNFSVEIKSNAVLRCSTMQILDNY